MTSGQEGDGRAPSVKRSVEARFSQVAAEYASSTVHSHGVELDVMIGIAHLTGAETILDAGCGPGHTALAFAPHVEKVIGLDLSDAMLAQGGRLAMERSLSNVEFRQGDVERLPFDDASFDLIVSRYSAHHWPSPEAALAEFQRVLRPDSGRNCQLLLADVVSAGDYTTDTHLQAVEVLRDASHVRDHTSLAWLAMLERAGFLADIALEWELPIDFESWVARMRTPDENARIIRTLLRSAPGEVQENLQVKNDGSFVLRCALIRAISVSG